MVSLGKTLGLLMLCCVPPLLITRYLRKRSKPVSLGSTTTSVVHHLLLQAGPKPLQAFSVRQDRFKVCVVIDTHYPVVRQSLLPTIRRWSYETMASSRI